MHLKDLEKQHEPKYKIKSRKEIFKIRNQNWNNNKKKSVKSFKTKGKTDIPLTQLTRERKKDQPKLIKSEMKKEMLL